MDASPIKAVADWMKTADLAEVVTARTGRASPLTLGRPRPGSALGTGDALGTLHPGRKRRRRGLPVHEPGKARKAEEGADIAVGDIIGAIVTGAGAAKPIASAYAAAWPRFSSMPPGRGVRPAASPPRDEMIMDTPRMAGAD